MTIIIWIVIGAVAGWLAEQLTGSSHGLLLNIVLGIAGSVVGGFVAGALGITFAGILGSIVIATAGAVGLIFLFRALKK